MAGHMIAYLNERHGTTVEPPKKYDSLYEAIYFESCQIPRLLKIGILAWHQGKHVGNHASWILDTFYTESERYYLDTMDYITKLDTHSAALLFLSCSVNFKLTSTVPTTQLSIQELEDQSIIFPYIDNSYVIPIFFWLRLKSANEKVYNKWKAIQQEMEKLVPGLILDDLYIYTHKWFEQSLLLTDLGLLWEKLIVSSLAVKYYLTHIKDNRDYLFLSEIYELDDGAQAKPILSKFMVNFCDGIIRQKKEILWNESSLLKAIYHNIEFQNAHHDIILAAKEYDGTKMVECNIAVQCKNSLIKPKAGAISSQLTCDYLLWFYPKCHADHPPKNYTTNDVKKALQNKRLGFLSGCGCASILYVDLIRVLKKMAKKNEKK
jgi:hypothetical protein